MDKLVDCLKAFNRKERYWLLKDAHGDSFDNLDANFIKKLNEALNLKIPDDAWWALDYHFDWISAAVWCFLNGKNPVSENSENRDSPDNAKLKFNPLVACSRVPDTKRSYFENSLVGNLFNFTIEDIDLIVSFNKDADNAIDNTILLIEAKADSSWSSDQFISKLNRLVHLRRFLRKLQINNKDSNKYEDKPTQELLTVESINPDLIIKLILISPSKPVNLIMDPASLEKRNYVLQKKSLQRKKKREPLESEIASHLIKNIEYADTLKWLGWNPEDEVEGKMSFIHIELASYNNNAPDLRSLSRCKVVNNKIKPDVNGDHICIL